MTRQIASTFVRYLVAATCVYVIICPALFGQGQLRAVEDKVQLRHWLENMVWHHHFSDEEIQAVLGLSKAELTKVLDDFDITPSNQPLAEVDPPIIVLPYPGGRHPRIGFLEGAIEPQRETKLSVFAPWDRSSYVVVDIPEAIWSNLGLTYLAHTHIDTIWTKQKIELPRVEWSRSPDGSYTVRRELPNGIAFQVDATPHRDHLALRMQLTNGTSEKLSDLRVQMCAMLKGMKGFDAQTNDNKIFRGSLAACRNETGDRWIIFGWEPNHRTWGNAPCPCLHSDPIIPDCAPGTTNHVDGWLSFYQGTDIDGELSRIDNVWNPESEQKILGKATDAASGSPVACRLYVRDDLGRWYFAEPATSDGLAIRYEKQNWLNPKSQEFHTSLSAHPFSLRLPPGQYTIVAERGKEYLTWQKKISVGEAPIDLDIQLVRWANMAERNWFSGDGHVHRPIREIAVPMLADDVNVALPMVYWTTRSERTAAAGDRTDRDDSQLPARIIEVDNHHVIWPKNTEWEIFSVSGKQHTLGAIFAVNHQTAFDVGVPPARGILEQSVRENALLDMDKHDWPFSMVLPPILGKSLTYELANNHMWRTDFAFSKWSTPPPQWMQVGDGQSGGEREWIEFTHRTYWTLLDCGFRLQPTAGTATGVHPVPIGYGRVYVNLPNGFRYDDWIEGLRQGRSFVTTGPLLMVDATRERIHGTILADSPILPIELIVNGKIVREIAPETESKPDGTVEVHFSDSLAIDSTSWVAVRVWQKSPNGRLRFAHSAPIWFDVPDKPIMPTEEEKSFLIDRMKTEIARSQTVLSPAAFDEYEQAMKLYESLGTHR